MKKFGFVFALVALLILPSTTSAATQISYLKFLSHFNTTMQAETSILSDLTDDMHIYDFDSIAYDALRLKNKAVSELSWLAKVSPKSCYSNLYNKYKSLQSAQKNLGASLRTWALGWPYSDGDTASYWLSTATSRAKAVKAALDKTRC